MPQVVFISAHFDTLAGYHQAASDAVRELGLVVVEVLPQHVQAQGLLSLSLQTLSQSDIFIGIYTDHYGMVLPQEQQSLIERLYEEAITLQLPRLIYLLSPSIPHEAASADVSGSLMRMFWERLKGDNPHLRYFTSPQDLAEKLRFDVGRLKSHGHPSVHTFQRRHFLIGLLLLWAVILILVLLVGPIR